MKKMAASIMCADMLHIADELQDLEVAECDMLHVDVMDGIYVNNLALGPEWVSEINEATNIPLDIHLACMDPIKYIDMFKEIEPKYISFHLEVVEDPLVVIDYLQNLGIKPSIAINPETSIERIMPYLEKIDMVLVMTVNPGFAGQPFNKTTLEKIKRLREAIQSTERKPFIQVDGNINEKTISLMDHHQPDIYVLGTSGLFHERDDLSYSERMQQIKKSIHEI